MKEEEAIESKTIDSSIWLEYVFEGKHREIIEGKNRLLLSIVSLFEIKKRLKIKKVSEKEIKEKMKYIKDRSILILVNENIADKAVDLSITHNLPAIDAIIYATSTINEAELLTLDNDFRGLSNAKVLDKEEDKKDK